MKRRLTAPVIAVASLVLLSALACSGVSRRAAPHSTAAPTGVSDHRGTSAIDLDLQGAPVLHLLGIPDLRHASIGRTFTTSFEDPNDLAGFYATPQSGLTHHEVSGEQVHTGSRADRAWVTGPGGPGLEVDGPNHRGYPTIQLQRLAGSRGTGFRSPTITELWVWLDVSLSAGQWISLAPSRTMHPIAGAGWSR